MSTNVRKKGVKLTIVELSKNEDYLFPRSKYSSVRNTLHTARVENPSRDWTLDIVDNGILITCIK